MTASCRGPRLLTGQASWRGDRLARALVGSRPPVRHDGRMRSVPAFLTVAAAVTLTPGPAFALLLQVAAAHGWRIALANIAANSAGVLIWGALSAAGISA